MQNKDKIETLLGFMVKAGKLVYGIDAIQAYKKKIHLLIVCSTCSDKTTKNVLFLAQKLAIKVLVTQKPLGEILFMPNCKVAALKDHSVANAILQNINENYQLF